MKNLTIFLLFLVVLSMACRLPQLPFPSQEPPLPTSTVAGTADAGELFPTATAHILPTATAPPQSVLPDVPIPDTPLARGDQAVFLGDWPSALSEYQAALDGARDPETQAAALAGLGRVYYRSGEAYNARQTLISLLEAQPDSAFTPEAHFLLAKVQVELGSPGDGAEAYTRYLETRPGVIDSYVQAARGDALMATNDYEGALTAYQAALASPHLTPDLDLELKIAQAYTLTGDTATALVMYPDIYQRSGADYQKAQIDYLLGLLYNSLGQYDAAYETWLDAVNQFPGYYNAYLSLVELVDAGYPVDELQRGIVDYYAGEYSVALAAIDRYLNNLPDDIAANPAVVPDADPARAYYFRGLILRALNDSVNAIGMWDYVIQNYPDSEVVDEAWEQKAYTQWAFLDEYPPAIQSLLDFVAAYPIHARAAEFLFDAARIAERDGDLALAAQLWERQVSEYPTASNAYEASFQAGVAQYRLGDLPAAQAQFIRAQQLAGSPGDRARAYFWTGKVYQGFGDDSAAQSTWQQTIQIDPTGYYSERARDVLDGLAPFAPPQVFDLGHNPVVERQEAENWLRQTFTLPPDTDLGSPGTLAEDSRLRRGLELWRLGEFTQASYELDNLRASVSNDPLSSYRLMNLLLENRIYRLAILTARQVLDLAGMNDATTLDAPKYFNRIRFGSYYADLVIPASQEFNLHPFFIWSMVRQESLFDPTIQSSAGARGLMQIIPTTAQDIANRMGWPPDFELDDLFRPQASILMGLNYFNDQRAYLYEDLYAALAAYNAGPGNAAVWRGLAPDDPDLFLEVVRFSEPQRYIKGIYEIYSIYRKLYERAP